MITKRRCFPPTVLEEIAKILGDTYNGLTGSQIQHLLSQAQIIDTDPQIKKWKRIYNAFANSQNNNNCSNGILNFIKLSLDPVKYVSRKNEFEEMRSSINQRLGFVGYQLNENGCFSDVIQTNTISEVQQRALNLKTKLENRNIHSAIFKYCKAELLDNNYFHAVFEANKGLFHTIRELSSSDQDGYNLIEFVFSKNPILIINNYTSKSEINEHVGFKNILQGLCGMFRNTEAHETKINWIVTEQDALEILSMISYCYRRLDNSQKIR